MSLSKSADFSPVSLSDLKEDLLIKDIVRTHDPDDREIDSEMLLSLVQSIFCCPNDDVIFIPVFHANFDEIVSSDIDVTGTREPISLVICTISSEILIKCYEDGNLHKKTLFLLQKLGPYRWDAKVVLALASFARIFGLFWLVFEQKSHNALAFWIAVIKGLPREIAKLNPEFKALNLLIHIVMNVTRLIIKFEAMYMQHELMYNAAMDITKSKIYLATYWIFRSILVCSSEFSDLRNMGLEQVHSDKTVIAAWRLHSLGSKLNSLCHFLGEFVDKCQRQIDTRLYDRLLHLFKEDKADNQIALRTLFTSQNRFPFKNASSGQKCGIHELKNKVVILLISKPEFLPIDKIHFLANQTCHHPYGTKTKDVLRYTILWVPISTSLEWTPAEKIMFELVSGYIPWLFIRRPWSLRSSVINYIKHEWGFQEEPIMVVLNEKGILTNSNAMDMVWVWGPTAFPFSASREEELWGQAKWNLDLIINGISTLSSEWVEEGRDLCIFGSDNLDWIREFNAKMKKIKSGGIIHFEMLYVGCNNPGANVKTIIETIYQEKLCNSLSLDKLKMFWFRLETMKRWVDRQKITARWNEISSRVAELLNIKESWAVIGGGFSSDVIKIDPEKMGQVLDHFPLWCKNAVQMGSAGAIRSAFEGPFGDDEKCHHTHELTPFEEGLIEKTMICASCKRPLEKFVVYKCEQ